MDDDPTRHELAAFWETFIGYGWRCTCGHEDRAYTWDDAMDQHTEHARTATAERNPR